MVSLTLKNLTKKFGNVEAVKNVSLHVPPGKLFALLGPSGCGKTTTLNMIAGLLEPSGGDILFNEESMLNVPAEKRRIGMVFQRYVLFPHMNVFENIAFGLRMQKLPKEEIQERVADVVKLVQLDGLEKRHPAQLSGGQMQRVAIARAVVIRPNLLLMDEPLANLDAKLRLEMREFIRNLQQSLGITTIFVTHDQAEAAVLADMVAVMCKGEHHQVSTPIELFNKPQSCLVAKFMGATNIFEGSVIEKTKETYVISSDFGKLVVKQATPKVYEQGDRVNFCIRPDHIGLSNHKGGLKGENILSLQKKDLIYEGDMAKYFLYTDDGKELQVHTPSTQYYGTEDSLHVQLNPERVWIIPN